MSAKRQGIVGTVVMGAACALLVVAPMGAARAAAAGSCVTGVVPVPFVLPDGSVHPAGEFTACPDRTLSPAKSLQRLSVAGATRGLFVATLVPAEADATRPYLTFHRAGNGEWILGGVTIPASGSRDSAQTYRLADRARIAELASQRVVGDSVALRPSADDSKVILLAGAR